MRDEVMGQLRFHVWSDVTAEQMRYWAPERIKMFFDGLVMVREATQGIKREARDEAMTAKS